MKKYDTASVGYNTRPPSPHSDANPMPCLSNTHDTRAPGSCSLSVDSTLTRKPRLHLKRIRVPHRQFDPRPAVKILDRYNLSAFFVTPPLPAPSGVVASTRLCCLSRVPPAVCPSLLESTTTVWTSFLQSLSTYVHTPTPHSILRFSPLHKHQIYIRPIFHFLIVHRVQHSHCSSIIVECC